MTKIFNLILNSEIVFFLFGYAFITFYEKFSRFYIESYNFIFMLNSGKNLENFQIATKGLLQNKGFSQRSFLAIVA